MRSGSILAIFNALINHDVLFGREKVYVVEFNSVEARYVKMSSRQMIIFSYGCLDRRSMSLNECIQWETTFSTIEKYSIDIHQFCNIKPINTNSIVPIALRPALEVCARKYSKCAWKFVTKVVFPLREILTPIWQLKSFSSGTRIHSSTIAVYFLLET